MDTIITSTPAPRQALWRGRFQGRPASPARAPRFALVTQRAATPSPAAEMSYEEQEELLRRIRESGL